MVWPAAYHESNAAALTAGEGAMGVARPSQAPREIAASLAAALLPENDVRSAWLFGSTAAGRARQDSDVDVGVWMDGDCTFERFADLAARIEGRTGLPIDLLVLDRASPLVVMDAVNGIPVLTRDERAQLEWVLQVSREAEDWGEFLASFLRERRRHREAFPR